MREVVGDSKAMCCDILQSLSLRLSCSAYMENVQLKEVGGGPPCFLSNNAG